LGTAYHNLGRFQEGVEALKELSAWNRILPKPTITWALLIASSATIKKRWPLISRLSVLNRIMP
jgi:hypothetical protein